MNFDLEKLPEELRTKLMVGTVGKMHLTGLAQAALRMPAEMGYVSLGVDMLMAAWEADPLDGMLAGQLQKLLPPDAPSGLRSVVSGVARAWQPDSYVQQLQQRSKYDQLFPVLEKKLDERAGKQPEEQEKFLYPLQRAVELGPSKFPVKWTRRFLASPWPNSVAPAVEFALSGLDMLCGDVEQARDRCKSILSILPLPGVLSRLGECELRMGNRSQALSLWKDVLALRPWDVSLLLKMYDVEQGVDAMSTPLDGPVNIFLYTFNKAVELDQCLKALADSELGAAKVTVLNNGSTDGTGDVLRKWADSFGEDRFEVITLPVNVGAPAARNWLLRRDDTLTRPWTIYLDDDAIVPQDWLSRFGVATIQYPDAGAWGCKVLDGELPHVIQNADLHPRPDYAEQNVFPHGEMSDLHHQSFDLGGFDYLRPCVSVTGCCHLFRTETLLESGDFDICFSPSQFDDLDHDLRLVQSGKMPVYQGHLGIRHMKSSGKLSEKGGMGFFNGLANHEKLKAKHSGEKWERIRQVENDALCNDVARKASSLKK